jgi:Glycosyl transferases group 1
MIAQAIACDLPTVALAVGGIPYLVKEGDTGLLFPFSDTKACAERILLLIYDDALRQSMEIRTARFGQERFDQDSVARRGVSVYREVLSRTKSAPTWSFWFPRYRSSLAAALPCPRREAILRSALGGETAPIAR